MVFGDPERWVALLHRVAEGGRRADEYARGATLRAEAFEEAPATSGTIDDLPFEWIADADVRLGPVLEAVVNGRYYWIPFHRIRQVDLEEPADLRDAVWMPAHFTWSNGGEAFGFMPTRYPGSEASEDDLVQALPQDGVVGARTPTPGSGTGQRMLTTDGGEYPLMDVRKIVLATGEAPGGGGGEPDRRPRVAELTAQERLQPSLLDRLTDDEPGNQKESRDKRVLTLRRIREGVIRDLAWLLNTANLECVEDLDGYPEVAKSVLNYGIPDLTGKSATGDATWPDRTPAEAGDLGLRAAHPPHGRCASRSSSRRAGPQRDGARHRGRALGAAGAGARST